MEVRIPTITGLDSSYSDLRRIVRRVLRSFQAPLTDTKALFIGPKYEEEPDWRARALENLDPSIKKVLLKDLGHDFYTAVPELVSKEIINWIQVCS